MNYIAENIKDSFDEIMQDFVKSEEYVSRQNEIENLTGEIKGSLPADKQADFRRLLNLLCNEKSDLSTEALLRGAVHGIALHSEIVGSTTEKVQ